MPAIEEFPAANAIEEFPVIEEFPSEQTATATTPPPSPDESLAEFRKQTAAQMGGDFLPAIPESPSTPNIMDVMAGGPQLREAGTPQAAWQLRQEIKAGAGQMLEPLYRVSDNLKLSKQQVADALDTLEGAAAAYGGILSGEKNPEKIFAEVAGQKQRVPTKAEAIVAGADQAITQSLDFFTSPVGIATLGTGALPKVAQRAISLAFVAQMSSQFPEQWKQFNESRQAGDVEGMARGLTGMGLSGAFITAAGIHVASPELKALAPATARAVEEIPQPKESNAIQVESPTSEVLRQQEPNVELQGVGTRNAQPEIAPGTHQQETRTPETDKALAETPSTPSAQPPSEPVAAADKQAVEAVQAPPPPPETPAPESPRAVPGEGKQPWQMTKSEVLSETKFNKAEYGSLRWSADFRGQRIQAPEMDFDHPTLGKTRISGGIRWNTKKEVQAVIEALHKREISKALREGKPVPPEVLADYPDLAKPAPTPAAPAPSPAAAKEAGKPSEVPTATSPLVEKGNAQVRPISEIQKQLSRTRAAVKISDPTKKKGKDARARLLALEEELRQATQKTSPAPSGPVYWTRESTQTDISRVKPTQGADMGERVRLANGQVWEYKGISGYRADNLSRVNGWQRVQSPQPLPPPPELPSGGKEEMPIGPGARTAAARPSAPESFEGTGLKHAIDELERVSYGFGERPRQEKQAMAEAWVRSGEKLAANPLAGVQLTDELVANPKRALSGDESALILRHKVALENAINNAAEKSFTGSPEEKISAQSELNSATDSLKILMDAVNRRGSEWGREGRWRQALAYEDYSFAAQERLATAAKGSPLTDSERATLHAEIEAHKAAAEAYEKHLAEKDAKIAEMEVKAALDKIELENSKTPKYSEKVLQHAEKFASYMDKKGSEALARIKERRSRMMSGIDPTELADLAIYGASKITRGLTDLGKWSAHMIEAVGDWVKPHLDEIRKASEARLDAELKNQVVFIKKTAGEKTGETVLKAVKDMTSGERQADLTNKIRSKVTDGKLANITPLVQKLARTFVEQGVRGRDALIDAVHGVLKGIVPDFTRRQAMDAISGYGDFSQLSKDAISVILRDLKGQMQEVGKLEDMAAGKAPLKSGMERREITDAQRELIKLVNEAKKKGGYEVTDPAIQLASAASTRMTALKNRIADLQKEISTGERLIKQRREPVTNPTIEALKSQLETLKSQHAEVFKTALEALKKRTERQIAEMERRIAEEDFSTRPKKEGPALDREAQQLLVKKLRVQQRLEDARRSWELKRRPTTQKIVEFFTKWLRREFVLSSPTSIAKLTAAAVEGLTFEPMKEAVGAGIYKAFPRFGARTLAETKSSVKIEANALKQAFMRSMSDAKQTVLTGKSDLEMAFGGRKAVPEEMVSYFGRLHAALKTPLKRAAFERVFGKLAELSIRAGKDVSDPMVQMEIGNIAMREANRMLFLEDNRLVQAYQRALSRFSQVDKATGKIATPDVLVGGALRYALPIVRIPTNLVARTVQAAVGFPVGATKLAIAFARGVEKLPPEHADLIMRQLKQGSIGGAFLLLGFFSPQMFGGYYQPGEKRSEKEAKAVSVKIGDYNIPSMLLHHPLLEVMQLGATVRRVADSKLRKKDTAAQGIGAGALAGALGLIEEVPFSREVVDLGKLHDPHERSQYINSQIAGMTEPQALQWLARQMDKKIAFNPFEDPTKRKPTNLIQNFEMGIPGLRQSVPIKTDSTSSGLPSLQSLPKLPTGR